MVAHGKGFHGTQVSWCKSERQNLKRVTGLSWARREIEILRTAVTPDAAKQVRERAEIRPRWSCC